MGDSVLKVDSNVRRLDLRHDVAFFSKLYIHEGKFHLWFSLNEGSRYYEPEFDMQKYSRWERVASFPLETVFSEDAVPYIIAHWLVWERPYKSEVVAERIAEMCLEFMWAEAKNDNLRFDRQKKQEEEARRDKFDKALVDGVV